MLQIFGRASALISPDFVEGFEPEALAAKFIKVEKEFRVKFRKTDTSFNITGHWEDVQNAHCSLLQLKNSNSAIHDKAETEPRIKKEYGIDPSTRPPAVSQTLDEPCPSLGEDNNTDGYFGHTVNRECFQSVKGNPKRGRHANDKTKMEVAALPEPFFFIHFQDETYSNEDNINMDRVWEEFERGRSTNNISKHDLKKVLERNIEHMGRPLNKYLSTTKESGVSDGDEAQRNIEHRGCSLNKYLPPTKETDVSDRNEAQTESCLETQPLISSSNAIHHNVSVKQVEGLLGKQTLTSPVSEAHESLLGQQPLTSINSFNQNVLDKHAGENLLEKQAITLSVNMMNQNVSKVQDTPDQNETVPDIPGVNYMSSNGSNQQYPLQVLTGSVFYPNVGEMVEQTRIDEPLTNSRIALIRTDEPLTNPRIVSTRTDEPLTNPGIVSESMLNVAGPSMVARIEVPVTTRSHDMYSLPPLELEPSEIPSPNNQKSTQSQAPLELGPMEIPSPNNKQSTQSQAPLELGPMGIPSPNNKQSTQSQAPLELGTMEIPSPNNKQSTQSQAHLKLGPKGIPSLSNQHSTQFAGDSTTYNASPAHMGPTNNRQNCGPGCVENDGTVSSDTDTDGLKSQGQKNEDVRSALDGQNGNRTIAALNNEIPESNNRGKVQSNSTNKAKKKAPRKKGHKEKKTQVYGPRKTNDENEPEMNTVDAERTENVSPGTDCTGPERKDNTAKTKKEPATVYKCEKCNYQGTRKKRLTEHMGRVHGYLSEYCRGVVEQKQFVCNLCDKVFVFGKDLNRHKKIVHHGNLYYCEKCNKTYKSKYVFDKHVATHAEGYVQPMFKCQLCEREFTTKFSLACHIKSEHLGLKKTYICPTCGKSFSQIRSYRQHANVHAGIRPYVCEICNKAFTYDKSLKEHRYMHDDIRRFPCTICNKAFRQRNCLLIHTKVHKGTKDHICSSCGKTFTQKQSLVRHERIHTGSKPYTCRICLKSFSDYTVIRKHVLMTHKKDKIGWQDFVTSEEKKMSSHYIVGGPGYVKRERCETMRLNNPAIVIPSPVRGGRTVFMVEKQSTESTQNSSQTEVTGDGVCSLDKSSFTSEMYSNENQRTKGAEFSRMEPSNTDLPSYPILTYSSVDSGLANSTQISTLGNNTQISTLGNSTQVSPLGNSTQISPLGNGTHISTLGNSTQISPLGNSTQISTQNKPDTLVPHSVSSLAFPASYSILQSLQNSPYLVSGGTDVQSNLTDAQHILSAFSSQMLAPLTSMTGMDSDPRVQGLNSVGLVAGQSSVLNQGQHGVNVSGAVSATNESHDQVPSDIQVQPGTPSSWTFGEYQNYFNTGSFSQYHQQE